jgi:hypothetical protein
MYLAWQRRRHHRARCRGGLGLRLFHPHVLRQQNLRRPAVRTEKSTLAGPLPCRKLRPTPMAGLGHPRSFRKAHPTIVGHALRAVLGLARTSRRSKSKACADQREALEAPERPDLITRQGASVPRAVGLIRQDSFYCLSSSLSLSFPGRSSITSPNFVPVPFASTSTMCSCCLDPAFSSFFVALSSLICT